MSDENVFSPVVDQRTEIIRGDINTKEGDFIGRPKPESIAISGDVTGDVIMGDKITIIQRFVVPLEQLRGRITLALTFAKALSEID